MSDTSAKAGAWAAGCRAVLAAGLLIAGPLPRSAGAEEAGRVAVRDLRIERQLPRDGAPEAAAYFRLHNAGRASVRLVGAASTVASRVEIRRTSRDGRRNRPLPTGVRVPPGATVAFARGGLSLRLTGWDVGPRHWTRVPLTLHFADGSELAVSAPVRR